MQEQHVRLPHPGRPQGSRPNTAPPPPLRYTEQRESSYSRGERGEDVEGGPLWSPVRAHHISSPYLNGIDPGGRPALPRSAEGLSDVVKERNESLFTRCERTRAARGGSRDPTQRDGAYVRSQSGHHWALSQATPRNGTCAAQSDPRTPFPESQALASWLAGATRSLPR